MLPVFAIIGRPNVGKSTLFNYLTKTRDALVINIPGVTRDRQYGDGKVGDRRYIVVDTGGIAELDNPEMAALTDEQVKQAMIEADRLLFLVDAKEGLTSIDHMIAEQLRRNYRDKVVLLVNKSDRSDAALVCSDFFQLGLGTPYPISATEGRGVAAIMQSQLDLFPAEETTDLSNEAKQRIRVAIIGRPNVGKSTLVNRLLGEDRVIVCDHPGTTRDSIDVPFSHQNTEYLLIDTAGVARRSRVKSIIEKFSMIKALQAIDRAHVVVMVLNAQDGVVDQDLRLLHLIAERGKALVLAINKWDGMETYIAERFKEDFEAKVNFADYARRYFISALHGTGVGKLYFAINEAYDATTREINTSMVTEALELAQKTHQPPLVGGRRIKLRYAHIGSQDPLVIVIHGKQTDSLPGSYQTFLSNFMREYFKLNGVPVVIKLKSDNNPYGK